MTIDNHRTDLAASRPRTGRGRPFPPDAVAAVKRLVETTSLDFKAIAAMTGLNAVTIARWARRWNWRRSEGLGSATSRGPGTPRPAPKARRYTAAEREEARARVEGSRLSLERIELELGIPSVTLWRWTTRYGWIRPEGPPRPGPHYHRYRRRGRPYAADAKGIAKRLAETSPLTQRAIARQAGVCQQTVSDWIRRNGWTRPPPTGKRDARYNATCRERSLSRSPDRQGKGYGPTIVAAARELFTGTMLSTIVIGARVGVSHCTVAAWSRRHGWTRPNTMPDAHGRLRKVPRRWW